MRPWVAWTAVLLPALFVLDSRTGHAQRIVAGFYGSAPPRFANASSFQGSFTFCRAMFESDRREKRGWSTDYPGADINFSIRLAELTKTRVARQPGPDGDPEYVVVRLTDAELFQCPYVLMEDAGTIALDDREATRCANICSRAVSCSCRTTGVRWRGSSSIGQSAACCRPPRIRP